MSSQANKTDGVGELASLKIMSPLHYINWTGHGSNTALKAYDV